MNTLRLAPFEVEEAQLITPKPSSISLSSSRRLIASFVLILSVLLAIPVVASEAVGNADQASISIVPIDADEFARLSSGTVEPIEPREPIGYSARERSIDGAQYLLPRFVVDTRPGFNESTLWAVRNEDDELLVLDVEYFDVKGVELGFERFIVRNNVVQTRNMLDVFSEGSRVEGYIRFDAFKFSALTTPGEISIDTFNVDSAKNFANGGRVDPYEPCQKWTARFLNFGTGLSKIDILTESLGDNVLSDSPTLFATLFTEGGDLIGTVGVFSENDVFSLDLEFNTTENFGSIEIDFGSGRNGLVAVRHSARGLFSVGHEGYCVPEELLERL